MEGDEFMSADCMVVLRKAHEVGGLKNNITVLAEGAGYGICYDPRNALLSFKQVVLEDGDFCFAPTDSSDTTNVDLLISHENHYVNGQCARLSLRERLLFIQELARNCLYFAESVEVYISEDNPFLPEYAVYKVPCDRFVEVVISEYIPYATTSHMIPSVAVHISGQ